MNWVKRFQEPSTYAGLAGAAAALGYATEFQALAAVVTSIFSAIAVFLPEKK